MNELPPVPSDSILRRAWSVFTDCLSRKNYSRLTGRSGRFEYWSTTIIGHFFCLLPLPLILISPNILRLIELVLLLLLIIYLAMPMLAVYVRDVVNDFDGTDSCWLECMVDCNSLCGYLHCLCNRRVPCGAADHFIWR